MFDRILVKLSGEALLGDREFGTDAGRVQAIAAQLKSVHDRGVEVAVVLGAGNIYRGSRARRQGWTGRPPTTWACWRSCSTR